MLAAICSVFSTFFTEALCFAIKTQGACSPCSAITEESSRAPEGNTPCSEKKPKTEANHLNGKDKCILEKTPAHNHACSLPSHKNTQVCGRFLKNSW